MIIKLATHPSTFKLNLRFSRALYTFSGYQIFKTTPIDTIKTNRDINNGSNVGNSKT
jgi:hypothetical protein